MNAGANLLSILYDLWIKSCTSLLWKSRLCLCEIRKRHLMNIVINLIKYTVQQFNRKEEWITWPPVPHKHSSLTSYFRYLDVFVLTEAAENLEVRSWVSERTNTRNISQTFPQIYPKHHHHAKHPWKAEEWKAEADNWVGNRQGEDESRGREAEA